MPPSDLLGAPVYFGNAEVRPGRDGLYVFGHAADIDVEWGRYPTREAAHAAARALDRLLSEYDRLDTLEWHAAKLRFALWMELVTTGAEHELWAAVARRHESALELGAVGEVVRSVAGRVAGGAA